MKKTPENIEQAKKDWDEYKKDVEDIQNKNSHIQIKPFKEIYGYEIILHTSGGFELRGERYKNNKNLDNMGKSRRIKTLIGFDKKRGDKWVFVFNNKVKNGYRYVEAINLTRNLYYPTHGYLIDIINVREINRYDVIDLNKLGYTVDENIFVELNKTSNTFEDKYTMGVDVIEEMNNILRTKCKNDMEENYVIIKKLPDAEIGTIVYWDDRIERYFYQRSPADPNINNITYLTQEQINNSPEYFCRYNEYPEYYAYNNPVFSRKDIWQTIQTIVKDTSTKMRLNEEFRDLGKENAKEILEKE